MPPYFYYNWIGSRWKSESSWKTTIFFNNSTEIFAKNKDIYRKVIKLITVPELTENVAI